MPHRGLDDRLTFLSHSRPRAADWRLAIIIGAISAIGFAIVAPYARVQLPTVWAFIPSYQAALATNDLITSVLLYVQFGQLRSRALLLLAAGYLFTALMAIAHALSFPGLFSPTGLLGATPQTTAWLYMFWHSGFPLLVIGYALLKRRDSDSLVNARAAAAISVVAVIAAATAFVLLATVGSNALPAIMSGNNIKSHITFVVWTVWALGLVALLVLGWRRPHSVLDLWLMVAMLAWVFDVGLAAVLNGGRFDLGFYVGRVYGLAAASFVLIVLLIESGALYAQLARAFRAQHERDTAEISNANARLSTVLDSSPLPIFSLDPQHRVLTWNAAAERIFGVAPAAAIGKPFASLQRDTAAFEEASQRVAAGETPRDLRTRWQHRDGRVLEISLSAAQIKGAATVGDGVVFVAEDITETSKLERQLIQAQKMDAVGQLTGGVAHDFNNILTVITGTIDLLHEGLADQPQLAAVARMIDDAAARGAELTRQLLAFARKQPLQPQRTDLNTLVAGAAKLLRPTLGEQIEIETALAPDAWP
ncbi:MAG: MASE4 domain-containing protein, partial [Alphaproteobacteria bacterium]|nr:MASE4 domain-containing protein [Alphaproteobacteria bacterium]